MNVVEFKKNDAGKPRWSLDAEHAMGYVLRWRIICIVAAHGV